MGSLIHDYNPHNGMCFQGDVSIIPVPDSIKISTVDEIHPRDGRLILAEGEVTGHHHAIRLPEPVRFREDGAGSGAPPVISTNSPRLRQAFSPMASAHLYRDPTAAQAMVSLGILTRADLVTAFLVIEGGPMVLTHDEHDGIRLPAGRYCIGAQIESAGAEERKVVD
jgi:hypothetical protein